MDQHPRRFPPSRDLRRPARAELKGEDSMDREELTELHAALVAVAEPTAEEKPQPAVAEPLKETLPEAMSVVHAPWIRPIGDYERRETTIVEGLRYG
jgi:hypothetical protein